MSTERYRLLFVDDEPDMLDTLRRAFRKDHEILTAGGGQAALEILRTQSVDLVLSDQRMPDLTGDQVLKFALEHQPDAIRILLTGYSDIESVVRCVNEAQIYKYISKPWEPEMLRLTVVRALESLGLERRLRIASEQLQASYIDVVTMLSIACEGKDEDTGLHVRRIQSYTEKIALELGLSLEEAAHMGLMSILHDVGKLAIPDAILKKPGPLDSAEWVEMKRHPEYGVKILGTGDYYQVARDITGAHHEHYDGTGYPSGLKGDDIPLSARIVKVADIFDALVSRRPYKEPWTIVQAIEHLQSQSGKHVDPVVIQAFTALIERGVIAEIMTAFHE